jgi:hypothetical protein
VQVQATAKQRITTATARTGVLDDVLHVFFCDFLPIPFGSCHFLGSAVSFSYGSGSFCRANAFDARIWFDVHYFDASRTEWL